MSTSQPSLASSVLIFVFLFVLPLPWATAFQTSLRISGHETLRSQQGAYDAVDKQGYSQLALRSRLSAASQARGAVVESEIESQYPSFLNQAAKSNLSDEETFGELEAEALNSSVRDIEALTYQDTVAELLADLRRTELLFEVLVALPWIVFMSTLLCIYERQEARRNCVYRHSRYHCQSVTGEEVDRKNHGQLVHMSDAWAVSAAPVRDLRFKDVRFEQNCLRLRTEVEVYQHIESTAVRKPKDADRYSYIKEWSAIYHDSSKFQDKSYQNIPVPGLTLGATTVNCSEVEYGRFLLPSYLVDQCDWFDNADDLLAETVSADAENGTHVFRKHWDGYFYMRGAGSEESSGTSAADVASHPVVGDARVCFKYVRDGPATVLALQAKDSRVRQRSASKSSLASSNQGQTSWDSFLPFRVVPRCSMLLWGQLPGDVLIAEARKSREELALEEQWTSCAFARVCCVCNLASRCWSGIFTPELFHLFPGSQDLATCYDKVQDKRGFRRFLIEMVLAFLIFLGFYLACIPPAMKWLVQHTVIGKMSHPAVSLSFMAVQTLVPFCRGCAYICYRQQTAIFWFALAVLSVALPVLWALRRH